MEKILFIALLLISFVSSAYADTHTSDSCSLADVSTKITASAAGDTVQIADGDCTWATGITITKYITLRGGIGTITGSSGYLLTFTPATPGTTNIFRVTNLTANVVSFLKLQTSSKNYTKQQVRIDNNTIQTSSVVMYVANGLFTGVVDSNAFTGYGHFDLFGPDCNVNADDPTWRANLYTYGSDKLLYFEDNTFAPTYDLLVSGGLGGQYAFRYNTVSWLSGSINPVWDMHGNQACNHSCGHRIAEIYGNNVTTSATVPYLADHRGGKVLGFYNKGLRGTKIREEFCDKINPCNHLSGSGGQCTANTYCTATDDGQPLSPDDSYYFGNRQTLTGSDVDSNISWENSCGDYTINLDDEIFIYSASFSGASGVGCGTLTNRPGTCTAGVAYWATDQSCSNLTDYVGASPTTPIAGTLYKCTATNTWTAYYTPYTYPHPLRGETDTTAPTATWAIDSTGLIATGTFSETVNATTKTGVSFTGTVTGAIGATYKDGMPGGIVRYDLDAEVQQAETIVVDYTTPGDGIKDLAGNALADISDGAVSNNSTQADPPLVTLTIGAHAGSTVNVYPGINCGSTCGPVEYDTGTVLTVSVTALPNYTGCTIGGTGCGASTTMSEARSCTVTCTKIAPDYTLGSGATVTIGSGAAATIQ